jgi:hypothetical protein
VNYIEPPMPRKHRDTENEVKADAESAFGSPPVNHEVISWQTYESRRISELEARLAQQRAARLAKAAQEANDQTKLVQLFSVAVKKCSDQNPNEG